MRLLLLANETLGSPQVLEEAASRAEPEVLLVAPAPAPRGILSGTGNAARKRAKKRLRNTVDALSGLGISARGELGSPRPLEAVLRAEQAFSPEEIVVTTYPSDQSEWSIDELVRTARAEVSAPVRHVVVPAPAQGSGERGATPRLIRLYHFAEPADAQRIEAEGLGGPSGTEGIIGGVWMIASRAGRRPEGRVAFAMDVPVSAVKRYEREPGFHDERRFFVPADIVSRLGPLAPLEPTS